MTGPSRRLILASRSQRRREILARAGLDFDVVPPTVEDAELVMPADADPREWVIGLAFLKASSITNIPDRADRVVLGADTVVVKDDQIFGQPSSLEDARRLIHRLQGGRHRVITGVALLAQSARRAIVDEAMVEIGPLDADRIDAYLSSDAWRGKAGGYNLIERLQDGWPIRYEGDADTITGLPLTRLLPLLERLGVSPGAPVEPADTKHATQ